MDYESFKQRVRDEFMDYMGPGFEHYEVREVPYEKRGKKCDGFSISLPTEGRSILPTLCLNEMYARYEDRGNFAEEMINAARIMKNGIRYGAKLLPESDYKKAGNKIVFQLINTAENEALLKDLPHRQFLDLSVIYRWAVDFSEDGVASVLINHEVAKVLGYDEEKLFERAKTNTRKLMPPVFRDIRELIGDMLDEEDDKDLLENMHPDRRMYVVTNKFNFGGAGMLLYESVLNDISSELGSDLYILPASVNELIVLTVSADKDPDSLAAIVGEINQFDVEESDRLSNNVYYYSSSTRKVYITSGELRTAG